MRHHALRPSLAALSAGASSALAIALALPANAQDRPDFQSPTACGQVWDVSTYGPPRNHAPDPDSLDFAMRDSNGSNISRDQPVLASARGTIRIDRTLPNGLRYIMIDHGGGWRTHYLHIAQEEGQPRLREGRKVATGEVIGRTSDSGSDTLHIHFAQVRDTELDPAGLDAAGFWDKIYDGDAVRSVFAGTAVATHQGNQNSWGRWSRDNAEEITSQNCPGNQFVSWMENGSRYIFRYRPGDGLIRVNRFEQPTASATSQTAQQDWDRGWTNFIDFLPDGSDRRHIMGYNFATGAVSFWEVAVGGGNLTKRRDISIYAGWTHMEKIRIDDRDYLVSYDSRYGHFNVDRINSSFTGFTSALKTNIGKGYTHMEPYWEGNKRFLVLYKGGSGAARIVRLDRDGSDVTVRNTWTANRATGWTHFATLPRGGKMYLFGYRQDTGKAKLWELEANGAGLRSVRDLNWSAGYTTITPFAHSNAGHLLVQKIGDGTTKTVRLRSNLSGFETVMSGSWAAGWR